MSLIDKAVSHFSSKARRELYVEEWDTTLYSRNLTLDDKSKWLSRAKDDTTDFLIYAVIFGVTDAEGNAVFDIGDKYKLRTAVDPEVVSKIASFVLSVSTDEEREKN